MSTPGLMFPTSNNAPLPIPGGWGNPTGANTGFNFGATPNVGFNFPAYGGPGQGGGGTPFPAYNTGSFTGTNLGGLNSGLGFAYGQGYGTDLYNMLGKAYGRGAGQLIGNILSGGLYNPQVAAAYLNAQQPGIARGEAGILGAFGDAGARFSSAAALGLGDYESQVQLNQQQMLAQLYQQAQQEELGLLGGVLPTLHAERANKGSWLNDVVGGLEVAGGVAAGLIPGGQFLAGPLIGAGTSTLTGRGGGGGGGFNPFMLPGYGGNTGTFGANAPSANVYQATSPGNVQAPTMPNLPIDMQNPTIQSIMQGAGAGSLGGANPWATPGGAGNNAPYDVPFPIDPSSSDQIPYWNY